MNIVNVGYDSANYYVVGGAKARLLVDVGMPGTLGKLRHHLGVKGLTFGDIRLLLCTHYHPDHAGIAQDVKQAGVQLLVLTEQRAGVPLLARYAKRRDGYRDIEIDDAALLACAESRALLAQIGIAGEVLHTPGHSDDSVSLVLDEGIAFTGDLPAVIGSDEPPYDLVNQSWRVLRAHGVKQVYPGHGPVRPIASFTTPPG
jgi:endoribonuclease LACTB2